MYVQHIIIVRFVCVIISSLFLYLKCFQSCFYLIFLTSIFGWTLVLHDMAHLHDFSYWLSQHGFVSIVDINECVVGTHNCHADSNCSNTKGSFYCTCLTGYSGDGVGCVGMCEDFSFVFILSQQLSNLFGIWLIDTDNSRIGYASTINKYIFNCSNENQWKIDHYTKFALLSASGNIIFMVWVSPRK